MKTETEIREAFRTSKTLTEASEKLGCAFSLANMRRYVKTYDIDTSHFTQSRGKLQKRICPICKKEFEAWECEKKITCGFSCANRYFRRNQKDETKQKISETLHEFYTINPRLVTSTPQKKIRQIHTNICPICKTTFQAYNQKQKYCSPDCRDKGMERIHICRFCDKKFIAKIKTRMFCSPECANKSPETRKKLSVAVQERVKNGTHQGWTSRNILSFPEKFFKKVFEQNGYAERFVTNHPVKKRDLRINCDACYFLDFYFPDYKLDVEIDGRQHERDEIKEHDEFRDKKLTENGYRIYRIKWKHPQKESEYIKAEIEKILNYLNASQYDCGEVRWPHTGLITRSLVRSLRTPATIRLPTAN